MVTNTMGKEDQRLPRMTLGLGLLIGKAARFYPKGTVGEPIEDTLGSEKVKIDV